MKIGERAENLRQTARRFDSVDSLVMSTREKLLGKEIVDNNRPEGEEMHIGDDNRVTHQYMPETNQGGGTLRNLALGAVGVGLIATGVGVPWGGWLISEALKQQPAPAKETVGDNDTLFDLELVE